MVEVTVPKGLLEGTAITLALLTAVASSQKKEKATIALAFGVALTGFMSLFSPGISLVFKKKQ